MKLIRYHIPVLLLPLFMPLFFTSGAYASQRSVIFHPKLGETVDSLANASYNLFGNSPAFSAARLYAIEKDGYRLHIVRRTQDGVRLLVQELSRSDGRSLLRGIDERMNAVEAGTRPPAHPVFLIQDPGPEDNRRPCKILLHDGSMLMGTFVDSRLDTLTVRTLGGLVFEVPDSSIGRVTALPEDYGTGRWSAADPNQSRLFFAPTGRKLKPGSLYFADYYVLFPTLAAGITDHFSVTAGVSLIPASDQQAYYMAPKWTFEVSANTGVAAGFMALKIPEQEALELLYAAGTRGNRGRSITLGVGVPFNRDARGNVVLVAGGEAQVSNRIKLITENWIITGSGGFGLFSGGVRFFGERLSVDLALITVKEMLKENGFPFIPYVDFAVFFGR